MSSHQITLANAVGADDATPVQEREFFTLLYTIASLSVAGTTLSLIFAAAISLMIWGVAR